jgi:HK97 gp10 family phage protein
MKFAPIMVDGFQELDAQLAAIGATLATEAADEAVHASANLLQAAWTQGAPYREGERSKYGHLRTNIRVRKVDARKANAVVYAVTTGNAFWGYFLEFGTVAMAPHPWARPIVERLRGEMVTVQIAVLNRKINEAISSAPKFGPVSPNGRNA